MERPIMDNIKGKVIVITGASSGLGKAAARYLSSQGASVVLGARREDRMQALADEIAHSGGKVLSVRTDVTSQGQVKALVDAAVQEFGRIDVMINNAGVMPHSPIERLRVDEWDRMIDVNIKGVLYGIAAALPYMKEQKAGHFINVSSVAGHVIRPGSVVYSATKYAVRVISEGLRQEVKPYNIRPPSSRPGTWPRNWRTASARRTFPRACTGHTINWPSPPIRSPARSPSPSASRMTWT